VIFVPTRVHVCDRGAIANPLNARGLAVSMASPARLLLQSVSRCQRTVCPAVLNKVLVILQEWTVTIVQMLNGNVASVH